jgi:glycosyltransferase involved in cell wall biosynthesis
MKVLNLMKTTIGGTWALRQMRELVKLGVEVHVVLPDREGLWPSYQAAGIQTHLLQTDFPLNKPWQLPKRLSSLRRLVVKLRPDIIHSHFVGTTLTMRMALRRHNFIPRIFQVPGPLHLEHPVFRWIEIATAQPNDFWIGTCTATKKRYLRCGVKADRVFMCYYGAYTDEILRRRVVGKLRRELKLGSRVPVIGMVSFMYRPKRIMGQRRGIKGHEDLIDAVAIATRQVPDLKVVFVGGAWDRAVAYERAVHEYAQKKIPGRAFFLGTRGDVPELYADFDIAVHPSHSENLGGAGESLLLGVPTIATNVGGFPDIVIPGQTGYLVPAKNPERMAQTIVSVLRNLPEARRLAASGQARIRAHVDVHKTACMLFAIYRTIAAGRIGRLLGVMS